MAKTQKYSEDQLLEAVIKYSEVEKQKIKATELAKWCRENIEGLEEVRDYHFTRSIKVKNEKTGKVEEKTKICTVRINEINKSRSIVSGVKTNILLNSSNIDTFISQPLSVQKKIIVETRETVDKLMMKNNNLVRESEVYRNENKFLREKTTLLEEKIKGITKTHAKLNQYISYIMKSIGDTEQRKILSKMGIEDNSINLNTYMKSLQQEINEVMNINEVLKGKILESDQLSFKDNPLDKGNESLVRDVLEGLNF